MAERIRQLLDDAVDQLEPRDTDPVGSVLRRERIARRRAAMAGVTAAVVAISAITAGGLMLNRPAPPVTEPLKTAGRSPGRTADSPPVPRVTDGTVKSRSSRALAALRRTGGPLTDAFVHAVY